MTNIHLYENNLRLTSVPLCHRIIHTVFPLYLYIQEKMLFYVGTCFLFIQQQIYGYEDLQMLQSRLPMVRVLVLFAVAVSLIIYPEERELLLKGKGTTKLQRTQSWYIFFILPLYRTTMV